MNPHRKDNNAQEEAVEAPTGPSRGGLTVTPFRTPLPRGFDEWISIWFNDAIYTIPNLRQLREEKSGFPDVKEYASFSPMGQKLCGAHMVLSFDPVCVRYDLVIATDTRLHFCAAELSRLDIVNTREAEGEKEVRAVARANRELLAQGALGLGGFDGMLDSMAHSTTLLSESIMRREDSVQMVTSPIKKLSWGKDRSKEFYMHESLGESESRAKGRDKGRGKGKMVSF